MQSTHSQNNSGRSLCWPALAAEFTVCTHTALLFVSHRTGDVFQSRVLEKEKKKALLALCTKFSAYCGTKFHELAGRMEEQSHQSPERGGLGKITQQIGVSLERASQRAWVGCKQEMSCLLSALTPVLPQKMLKKGTGRTPK